MIVKELKKKLDKIPDDVLILGGGDAYCTYGNLDINRKIIKVGRRGDDLNYWDINDFDRSEINDGTVKQHFAVILYEP